MLCAASAVGAVPIIDQNQSQKGSTALATFIGGGLVQSFQQTHSNIAGAGIFLQKDFGTSGDVTIALFASLADAQQSKTPLRSATGLGTQNAYLDVFWTPLDIKAGDLYFLLFTQAFPTQGTFSLGAAGVSGNVIAGQAYFQFEPINGGNADYTFRTYYDDGVRPVPEPGTLALLGLAAAGLAFTRRRSAS